MSIHEDWKDPERSKRGMSTGMKVLLTVGTIGGICLLLCCGGVAFFLAKVKNIFEQAHSNDPAIVRQRAREIAAIEIPPGFEPAESVDFFVMRMVEFKKPPDAKLVLMESAQIDQGQDVQEQRDEMLRNMREQQPDAAHDGDDDIAIDVQERRTRQLTVRGRTVEFEFTKGTEGEGKVVRQVSGSFPTSRGTCVLILTEPEETYDEAAVLKMLSSIGELAPEAAPQDAEPAAEEQTRSNPPAERPDPPQQPESDDSTSQ